MFVGLLVVCSVWAGCSTFTLCVHLLCLCLRIHQAVALFVGLLGEMQLKTYLIFVNMNALVFMLSLSLGVSGSTLVGNALGAGDGAKARETTWLIVALSVGVLAGVVVVELATRSVLGFLFTDDAEVVGLLGRCIPVGVLLQLFDALQGQCVIHSNLAHTPQT